MSTPSNLRSKIATQRNQGRKSIQEKLSPQIVLVLQLPVKSEQIPPSSKKKLKMKKSLQRESKMKPQKHLKPVISKFPQMLNMFTHLNRNQIVTVIKEARVKSLLNRKP